jgi:lysophospholipid acyltransferase (LPLAT)-like uncharacterized protein
MRVPDVVMHTLAPAIARPALGLLGLTLRVRRDERAVSPLWSSGEPLIYATWHSRVLLLPWLYRGRRLRVLTSRSRHGEMVARVVQSFGLEVVRGSSSRGGADALRRLLRALRDGSDVMVVPDGPRGPREVAKPGVVALAAASGAAIVPVAVSASREWRLRSWDGFRIPQPGARLVVGFAEPLRVPARADHASREAARKDLEASLGALTERIDAEAAR